MVIRFTATSLIIPHMVSFLVIHSIGYLFHDYSFHGYSFVILLLLFFQLLFLLVASLVISSIVIPQGFFHGYSSMFIPLGYSSFLFLPLLFLLFSFVFILACSFLHDDSFDVYSFHSYSSLIFTSMIIHFMDIPLWIFFISNSSLIFHIFMVIPNPSIIIISWLFRILPFFFLSFYGNSSLVISRLFLLFLVPPCIHFIY